MIYRNYLRLDNCSFKSENLEKNSIVCTDKLELNLSVHFPMHSFSVANKSLKAPSNFATYSWINNPIHKIKEGLETT